MSKPSILNLCNVVRNAFQVAGYSTVKAVNAVNGYLSSKENQLAGTTEKTSGGKITGRKEKLLKTKLTITESYEAGVTAEAMLVDFNTRIAEVANIHPSMTVTLPKSIALWLDGFAKVEPVKTETETAPTTPTTPVVTTTP